MGGGNGFKRLPERGNNKTEGEWSVKHSLLSSTLQLAVPLWVDRLRGMPWEHIEQRAKECSQIIAEKGDIILFKSEKKGETAKAFNALAEGIACLSFVPGGVKTFGGHWESCLDEEVAGRSMKSLLHLLDVIQNSLGEQ